MYIFHTFFDSQVTSFSSDFFFRVRIVPTRENYSYSIHTGELFPIDETTREKSAGIRVRGEQRYFHSLFGLESVFKPFKPTLHPIPGKAPSIFKTRLSKSFEYFGSRKQTTFSLFCSISNQYSNYLWEFAKKMKGKNC